MIRGLGFVDPEPDIRDREYQLSRIAQPAKLPKSVDLTKYVDHIRDQGSTSSCVGFAVTRACHIRAQIQGISNTHGSPLYAYAIGRANANTTVRPLTDDGSNPRNVIRAIRDFGLVSEDAWKFDKARVNELPDWAALEGGDDSLDYGPVGYYWLANSGEQKLLDLKSALASGFPVAFAMDVEPDMLMWDDATPIPDLLDDEPIIGSHMLCAVGYDNDDNVMFVNSWGAGFGDFGHGVLSKARFMNDSTRAMVAIEVAPRVA